ncbi:TPA: transporter substrate-binding domain-containing protein [Xanthomonas vasicola pv. zeae]|uniref:ArtI protein n=1 Tax=Xanthomonas vasicola pv. vasculorum TaxID=325776 RepID=A0AAE8JWY6_XANVA|nr:transporter substrate-binding domain-containing protein [Xanthomonas vasicola]AVQ05781.1 ArtI protein [Xanthomonas vasicola pv. vasculorum]AZM69980.1 ArtI protein [Xanthomonas vasicola pv. vasculorum]AZR28097.1 transporter substrate-binding domain-containing protein [Xanthomonas vasicola pv. arecae]AZR33611.1 transporter substrate-binding domain-containing protein [Xanthomonas vasicola]KEZ99177.1 ArtI protein [Xanthomonas vasicola pv. vasculorum NCPPB 895]
MRYRICLALVLSCGMAHAAAPASRLDVVLQSGVLRVCTTGDYRPYSLLREDGQFEGSDIDLAQSLATSLGARVRFVRTSWPQLMPDLLAERCDIAVGGISVTLQRQRQASFSAVLDVDGKIPLVRCADQARYRSMEQLNRPQVRVIEPPGGTNEAFARRELPRANVRLFADNTTIFEELLEQRADVMITDASEALYQQARLPGLCAIAPEHPLQYSEKAFLLPRDDQAWKAYVDQWLHLSKASGEYRRIVEGWRKPR